MIWSEFIAAVKVLLTTDANRAGASDYVDATIRLGVLDLQHFIRALRTGWTTTYSVDDLDVEGSVSTGNLPGQVVVRSLYKTTVGHTCCRVPYVPYPGGWEHRYDLTCQSAKLVDHGYTVWDPYGDVFWLYPAIEDGYEAEMVWDGVKLEFEDEDTLPSAYADELTAMAVADYVKARVSREVKNDLQLANSFKASYMEARQQLYLRLKNTGLVQQTTSPSVSSSCSGCAGDCEDLETHTDAEPSSAD